MINKLVLTILFSQSIVCSLMAIGGQVWQVGDNKFDDIITEPYYRPSMNSFLNFFTYFILLNTLLPISLQVALEVVKLVQAYYIDIDVEMYSEERDKLVTC